MSGVLAVALVTVVAYFTTVQTPPVEEPTRSTAAPIGPAPWIDLSTLTEREAADRLFDRVMRAAENSDLDELRNFLPMAVAAYQLVDSLDADGTFHLATLQRVGGDPAAALTTARATLREDPNHLLMLYEAAAATLALGDSSAARDYSGQILALFENESVAEDSRYEHHRDLLPAVRTRAQEILLGF